MQRNILPLKPTQPGHADVVNTLKHETHIEIQLGDILPALTDALLSQRLWIRDFSEDKISISKDFYEIIMAYQRLKRSA